jgi:hypothetical protein
MGRLRHLSTFETGTRHRRTSQAHAATGLAGCRPRPAGHLDIRLINAVMTVIPRSALEWAQVDTKCGCRGHHTVAHASRGAYSLLPLLTMQ